MTSVGDGPANWAAAATQMAHARRIAAELERDDLVARIDVELRGAAAQRPLTIIVVGETSRGKSGLINALLSMPELLPVDSDVTTGAFVLLGYGDTPDMRVYTRNMLGPIHGNVQELADWASVARNPNNQKGVTRIEVDVPCELLREGVWFADTPGVGGLDSIHGIMTLTALEGADAMLFVLDSLAPLSEPELRFLTSASRRIQTVVFAVTKTDLNPLGWGAVLAENRQLMREAAPRFANHDYFRVRPLDAKRAAQKRLAGDAEAARRLDERSGIRPLSAHLRTAVIQRSDTIRVSNTYRLALSVLERSEADCRERQATLNCDPRPLADLQTILDELAAIAQADRWIDRVRQDFDDLNQDVRRLYLEHADDWRQRIENEIELESKAEKHRDLRAELEASSHQIAAEVDRNLTERILQIAAAGAERLGIDDFPAPEATFVLPYREPIAALSSEAPRPNKSLMIGALVLGQAASVIRNIVLSGGTPLALIVAPLSLGPTVSSVYTTMREEAQSRKADERRLLKEYDDRFRQDVSYAIDDTLRAARDDTEAGLRRTIEERRLTAQQRIQKLMAQADRHDEVDAALRHIAARIDEIARLRTECSQQLQALGAPPSSEAGPPPRQTAPTSA